MTRLNSMKIKPPALEVQLDWQEAGESCMLILLSLFLYISVVFTQLAFVPVMIITIKRGWKEAAIYTTAAAVVLFYLMLSGAVRFPMDGELLLFSPVHFLFDFLEKNAGFMGGGIFDYYVLFGGFGIFLGYLVSRNYRLNFVIFTGLVLYVTLVIFALAISTLVGGFDRVVTNYSKFVDQKTKNYVSHYLSEMDQYKKVLSSNGIDYTNIEKTVHSAAEIYKKEVLLGVYPRGGILIKQIVVIFLSIVLVKLYFKRRLNKASLFFNIRNYRISNDWVWGLVVSWGLIYVNLHLRNVFLGILSWNMAVVFSFLFFLKGLSIVKTAADRIKVPVMFQYLFLVILFLYSLILFATLITGIGVADIWLGMKEKIEKKQKE